MGIPIVKAVNRLTHAPMLYTHETLQVLLRCNRNISSLKARRQLSFYPRPLAETLKDTFDWYEENGKLLLTR